MKQPKHPNHFAAVKRVAYAMPGNATGSLDPLARELGVTAATMRNWTAKGAFPRAAAVAAVALFPQSGVTVADLEGKN